MQLALSPAVIAAAVIATAALFLLVLSMLLRSRRRSVITGKEALIGAQGESIAWQEQEGRVRVNGEIWRARAGAPLAPGIRVKGIGRDGLVLTVEPV
jgi:membrane-bound serine protease (ClpP class)